MGNGGLMADAAALKLHREHCRELSRKTTSWTLS